MTTNELIIDMYITKRSVTQQIKDFLLKTVEMEPKLRLQKLQELIDALEDSWK